MAVAVEIHPDAPSLPEAAPPPHQGDRHASEGFLYMVWSTPEGLQAALTVPAGSTPELVASVVRSFHDHLVAYREAGGGVRRTEEVVQLDMGCGAGGTGLWGPGLGHFTSPATVPAAELIDAAIEVLARRTA